MSTTLDDTANIERDELLDKAAAFALGRKGTAGPPGEKSAELLRVFYRHVPAEDILARSEVDLYGAAMSQYKLAARRPQGTANIRVFTPTVSEHGWSAGGHTVVEVVTDDMPFLVDSVTMELNEESREVHMVVHPQILVRRDVTGELQEVFTEDDTVDRVDLPHDISRESWMHLEIGRESSPSSREDIEHALSKVLLDVREAVEDWPKMHAKALDMIDDLGNDPPPLSAEEVAEGQALLRWLADEHFTFLGYREYRLEELPDEGDPRNEEKGRPGLRAASRPRHRAGHPPVRPGHVAVVRQAAADGARQGAREDACWCSPRPTRGRRCTGPSTSTTSGSRRSRTVRSSASAASSGCSPRRPTRSR